MTVVDNRAIIEETPLYYLLYPDNRMTPGFAEVVPKVTGNKRLWCVKVKNHLAAFSDPLNKTGVSQSINDTITYQPTHRFSYEYRGGSVAVIPTEERVEIAMAHKNRMEVVLGLMRLMWTTRKMGPQGSPSVQLIVNN